MNPETVAQTLSIQFNYTAWALKTNLQDLSDADGVAAPAGGGNCLDWIVGHLVNTRAGCLKMLGVAPPFPADKYARFARGSAPVGGTDDTPALSGMIADFNVVQPLLLGGLRRLDAALFAAPAPFSPRNDPDETVGTLLVGLAFHEAYHVGQLGAVRRAIGRAGVIA